MKMRAREESRSVILVIASKDSEAVKDRNRSKSHDRSQALVLSEVTPVVTEWCTERKVKAIEAKQ